MKNRGALPTVRIFYPSFLSKIRGNKARFPWGEMPPFLRGKNRKLAFSIKSFLMPTEWMFSPRKVKVVEMVLFPLLKRESVLWTFFLPLRGQYLRK